MLVYREEHSVERRDVHKQVIDHEPYLAAEMTVHEIDEYHAVKSTERMVRDKRHTPIRR